MDGSRVVRVAAAGGLAVALLAGTSVALADDGPGEPRPAAAAQRAGQGPPPWAGMKADRHEWRDTVRGLRAQVRAGEIDQAEFRERMAAARTEMREQRRAERDRLKEERAAMREQWRAERPGKGGASADD